MFLRAVQLGHATPARCHNGASLAYLALERPEMALAQLDLALAADPAEERAKMNKEVCLSGEWMHVTLGRF
jgi:hypothetical protein